MNNFYCHVKVDCIVLLQSFASRWPKRDNKGTINIDEPQVCVIHFSKAAYDFGIY